MQVRLAEIHDPPISLLQAHCDITCYSLKNTYKIILNHKWTKTIVCTPITSQHAYQQKQNNRKITAHYIHPKSSNPSRNQFRNMNQLHSKNKKSHPEFLNITSLHSKKKTKIPTIFSIPSSLQLPSSVASVIPIIPPAKPTEIPIQLASGWQAFTC